MAGEEPRAEPGEEAGTGRRRGSLAEFDARFRRALAGVGGRLDRLDQRGVELAGALTELLPRVDDLADRTSELSGRVDALAQDRSNSDFAPIHWPTLSADEASEAWDALGRWVEDVLGPWYGITRGQLPDCWALHRRALIELSWLRSSYVVAYGCKAPASLAAEWHTRWLRDGVIAIKAAIPESLCRPGEHLQPAQGGSRYAPPSRSAPDDPAPGRHFVDPRTVTTTPQHWRPWFEAARRADLDVRRRRDPEEGQADQPSASR